MLLAGILLIAINLRPALSSVGPLVEPIQQSTGLPNSLIGLLTTLPLVAFGIVSTLTPLLTRRLGIGGTLLGAMVLLAIGTAMRSVSSVFTLYLGTLLLGVAIAFGNVLLPSLTKRNFASRGGAVTSLYSATMGLGATIAAGASVPLADGLGWRGSLGSWAVLSLFAAVVWIPQVSRLTRSEPNRSFIRAMKDLGASKLAWQVALFMGLQSLTFYVVLAWLPAILTFRGYTPSFSGWMLSLSQFMGILGSLIIPTIAGAMREQRGVVWFLTIAEAFSLVGMLIAPNGLTVVWVSVIGFVLGGSFGLALLFLVIRSHDAESATELSGMAQSVGYLVAATGPTLFGLIFDYTGAWTWSITMLFLVAALKLAMGLGAGVAKSV
ncbi:putative transporter YycB [Stieleria maiorica]|uniref:Putative transporter YycB n=1 Tax=Stieleria maiorica TaxID=2795974 RepID=A0A5B9ME39_9BACT|nr:putative transporter YycB [Stieleria maiorica]